MTRKVFWPSSALGHPLPGLSLATTLDTSTPTWLLTKASTSPEMELAETAMATSGFEGVLTMSSTFRVTASQQPRSRQLSFSTLESPRPLSLALMTR